MHPLRMLPIALVVSLAGCASTSTPRATREPAPVAGMATTSPVLRATVALAPASGTLVSGKLEATATNTGVHFRGDIGGLTPNSTHAIHIHEKGDCSAADATSAGGHFNPAMKPHGRVDGPAHHGGDMLNIVAGSDGVAKVDVHAEGVVLGGSAPNDALGRAVIVHASPDDYVSQPSGNAGNRIACGVIANR